MRRTPVQAVHVGVLLGVFGAFSSEQAASEPRPSRREISEPEFRALLNRAEVVSGAIVPAHYLAKFLSESRPSLKPSGVDLVFVDCEFRGPLDVQSKRVGVGLTFTDVTFTDNVVFHGDTFGEDVAFRGMTRFERRLNVQGATFRKEFFISAETTLAGSLLALGARFEGGAELRGKWISEPPFFDKALFRSETSFDGARFCAGAQFGSALFERAVEFLDIDVPLNQSMSFTDGAHFTSTASFVRADLEGDLVFRGVDFDGDVYLALINRRSSQSGSPTAGRVRISSSYMRGRSYFNDSRLAWADLSVHPEALPGRSVPNVFEKQALFQSFHAGRADFSETEFRDFADFYGARFDESVRFDRTTFAADVDFRRAKFPSATTTSGGLSSEDRGLWMDRVRFQRTVGLDIEQLQEPTSWWCVLCTPRWKLRATDPETWRILEDVFHRMGDLRGVNESFYQRRLWRSGTDGEGESLLWNRTQWAFWGFGVRPWRLATWMVAVFIAFTAIYWTQTADLGTSGRGSLRWRRLRAAAEFSIRTAVALDYGRQRSRTMTFKIVTALESALFKVLSFFFLKALANTSPLINELVSRLLG
jgi:hypothetical protein